MQIKGGFEVYRIATATMVVQLTTNSSDEEVGEPDFAFITNAPDLRASGGTCRRHEGLVEFRVDIEYGPANGSLESTLELMLKQMTQQRADVHAAELFSYRHRDATPDELRTELARLDAQSDDMAVPLRQRKALSEKASQIRKFIGA